MPKCSPGWAAIRGANVPTDLLNGLSMYIEKNHSSNFYFLNHVPCFMLHVPCSMFHVSCFMFFFYIFLKLLMPVVSQDYLISLCLVFKSNNMNKPYYLDNQKSRPFKMVKEKKTKRDTSKSNNLKCLKQEGRVCLLNLQRNV